jgi:hypothetical protein
MKLSDKWVDRLIVAGIVMFAVSMLAAAIPSRYYKAGLFTLWVKTDTSLAVNIDTTNYGLRNYIKYWGRDTTGAVNVREEIQFTGICNFSNAADDSTILQVYGQAYSGTMLLYSMYLDRFMINSAKPAYTQPVTFRDDLPILTCDSVLVFHVGKHSGYSAGARGFISVYKVDAGTALSPAVTAGTFYDMALFDEALYPATGTSVQLNAQISLKKRR